MVFSLYSEPRGAFGNAGSEADGVPLKHRKRLGGGPFLELPGTPTVSGALGSSALERPRLGIQALRGRPDRCSGRRLTLEVLCPSPRGPDTWQKPLHVLLWTGCAELRPAVLVRYLSRPLWLHYNCCSGDSSREVASVPALPPRCPVLRFLLPATEPAMTPESHNCWHAFYGGTDKPPVLLGKH